MKGITLDEIDALPIVNTEPFKKELIRNPDGTTTMKRTFRSDVVCLLHKPTDYAVVADRHGNLWSTGWLDGKLVKSDASTLARMLAS